MIEPPTSRRAAQRPVSSRKAPYHPEQHRPRLRREIPTPRQLGKRPSLILLRGLMGRCPACGGRHIFKRWFGMESRCPTCTLHFERVDGHWIGSLGTSMVSILGIMFAILITTVMVSYPDPSPGWLLWTLLGVALVGPVLFFPSARMLWTAIDLLLRPLRYGEIDPRFVEVDPYRDRPVPPDPPTPEG